MEERKKIQAELAQLQSEQLRRWQAQAAPRALPENYLEDLAGRVIAAPAAKRLRLPQRTFWALAASVAFLLAASWLVFRDSNTPVQPQVDLTQLSDEAILLYVNNNIDEFDLALLTEGSTTTGTVVLPSNWDSTISSEAIENYLEAEENWPADMEDQVFF
ncbi:MAG: hypothetical protein DA408_14655 [Bacteroidetes bacterium]|nr:MAG: hypothetical protein C7N36_11220 [Bacteroidota bacterium]PTM11032.1 MAG: hypothetical protein DA408_14655 [Bacteroidota bacterium]